MNNLQFIKKLCKGSSSYSDHMNEETLKLIHIESGTEELVREFLEDGRMLFITGNPGDGKTYLIKILADSLLVHGAKSIPDVNSEKDSHGLALRLSEYWRTHTPCVVAVNEYPFLQLLKEIKSVDAEMYNEIHLQHSLNQVYSRTIQRNSNIVVIDLNNRNLLATERFMPERILKALLNLLRPHIGENRQLDENIDALSDEYVQGQLNTLFSLVELTGRHFPMRDILEAMSYMLTSCVPYDRQDEDDICLPYYDALFTDRNSLLNQLQVFDPAYISIPDLDEALWNGEVSEEWGFGAPTRYPCSIVDDEHDALTLFKSIKRKYFFENSQSRKITDGILDEYKDCQNIFATFDAKKREHKRKILRGLNKLFISQIDCSDRLQLWTLHNYDQTREPKAAVCRRYISDRELELNMPVLPDWLKKMEYTPNNITLSLMGRDNSPALTLDISFLRTVMRLNAGYPLCLVSQEYLKALRSFSSRLETYNAELPERERFIEENDNIVIANRATGHRKHLTISNDKLDLNGGEE